MSPREEELSVLYQMACEQRKAAHAPYSGFAVGASVETVEGKIYTGCNIENGAYGVCLCAEQVAIAKAVSDGHRGFRRIVIVAQPLATPCGACRQVMSEFFDSETMVYAMDAEDSTHLTAWTMQQILPDQFRLSQ